ACRKCLTNFGIGTLAAAVALAMVCFAVSETSAGPTCKPSRPRPLVHLKSMGPCAFDPDTLSFVGVPLQQAACLLRALDPSRNLAPGPADVPAALAARVGRADGLPAREAVGALPRKLTLPRHSADRRERP